MGKEGVPGGTDPSHIPDSPDKLSESAGFSRATSSDINRMRIRLMEELRTPFVERVNSAPNHSFIRQVKTGNFDERVMTLKDREIFDLYTEYQKIRSLPDEDTKETVRDSLLDRLAFSILSDGRFLKRIFNRE